MRENIKIRQTGFSLIELMVVVAIISIITVLGIGPMQETLASNKSATIADTAVSLLKQARVQAIEMGTSVTVTFGSSSAITSAANGQVANNTTEYSSNISISGNTTYTFSPDGFVSNPSVCGPCTTTFSVTPYTSSVRVIEVNTLGQISVT